MKEKTKVLYLITKATWGGAQRYVYDLATNLPKKEFEPIVAYGTHGKLADNLLKAGIKVKRLCSLGRDVVILSDIKSFFEIYKTVRQMKPNVVHLNSSKAAALGALAARLTGVPRIIFTVHGWPFEERRHALSRALIYLASWITALLSHIIVVVSRADASRGERMWLTRAKIRHVPLGIAQENALVRSSARETILSLEIAPRHERDVWITTIAELHPNKNLIAGIDAVAEYNEVHFPRIFYCIIGDGEMHQKLDAYLTRRRIREQVMLLGFVPEASRILKAFDIFFLPSAKEGLPYVLLEAGQAGLAVVGANTGGVPDIVTSRKEGILRPHDDVKGFAESLYELAKDREKRISIGQELRRRVLTEFKLEDMVAKTIALYLSTPIRKPDAGKQAASKLRQ